ncbi:MAG: rhodanese-like domain-containing protein [Anaerostipes sp.]|jgi:rhodanese-related sulfurtransferase|nr:rhodanese-like domain-containing protein [Anaerostipes sp.]
MDFINISMKEGVQLAQKKNNLLVDVREPAQYKKGHLKSAINIPYGIIQKKEEVENKSLIVYCDYGGQSMLAARHLAKEGYIVYNIVGGVHYYRGQLTALGFTR